MKRSTLAGIVGIILLAILVINPPFEVGEGDFSKILRAWGNKQAEQSEEITHEVVKGAEGTIVGEYKVDGSNWSIPNIVRHLLGGD